MAASPKHQLVHLSLRAGLSLPALSFLALLSGFTFSLTLPSSSLQALIPAMESLFLVSLPQLWKAFLSWVTPPCLFVLLNGIIMILTATSCRSLSSSRDGDDSSSSELEPGSQLENVPYKQGATDLGSSLAEPIVSRGGNLLAAGPDEVGGPITDIHIPPAHCMHMQDAEDIAEIESTSACAYSDDKQQIVVYTNPNNGPSSVSTAAKIDHVHESISGNDPSTSLSESEEEEMVKGGSEPASPHCSSSSALRQNTARRRSMSIDVTSVLDTEGDTSEQLSEEAFRKRIEDFIFKMNSKIRSETTM